jgi:hypothetical protein
LLSGLRYDTQEAREMAAKIAEFMRDRAYLASVELAKERGAFPMFNKDLYLSGGNFASRLPNEIKAQIREHGIRNSHLLSIAPTGTISLAFADNASNGSSRPSLDVHAQEAHGRWHAQGIPRRGPRVAPLSPPPRQGREASRLLSSPRSRSPRRRTRRWWPRSPRSSTRASRRR